MSNNKFIDDDWEKIYAQEQFYIQEERKRAEIREWELWEHEHQKPAKINVEMPKRKEKQK